MKKKPARKGRFFHALNVPRALCRTPRKETPGQGLGGLLPAERRERELFGGIPGCSFRASVPRRRSFAQKNSGSGARFLAAQVLPANAASLQAAAGLIRTGTPAFRPGMGEVAAQRAGGTRPFLRRCAASLHAAAAGLMRTGTPMFCPGMGEGAAQRAGVTRHFLRWSGARFLAAQGAGFARERRFFSRRRIRGSRVRNRLQNISKNRKKVGKKVDTPRRLC